MHELLVVSLLSPNVRAAHEAIVGLVAECAGLPLRLAEGSAWREQLAMLDAGEARGAFICGLPYTRRPALVALAAPVQQGARYGGRPVYFADVVVAAESPFRAFADLRGARFAYNEPDSLSGYAVMRAHLAGLGQPTGFFGAAVESGAHLESLRLVAGGAADAAAIDSTVLELALRDNPALAGQIRSCAALGPYPAPPFVVARSLPEETRARLTAVLTGLHENPAGRAALALARLERFEPATDADYDPIRRLAERAARISLT